MLIDILLCILATIIYIIMGAILNALLGKKFNAKLCLLWPFMVILNLMILLAEEVFDTASEYLYGRKRKW